MQCHRRSPHPRNSEASVTIVGTLIVTVLAVVQFVASTAGEFTNAKFRQAWDQHVEQSSIQQAETRSADADPKPFMEIHLHLAIYVAQQNDAAPNTAVPQMDAHRYGIGTTVRDDDKDAAYHSDCHQDEAMTPDKRASTTGQYFNAR